MLEKIDLRAVMKGVVVFVGLFITYQFIGFVFGNIARSLRGDISTVGQILALTDRVLWIASVIVPGMVAGRAAGKNFFLHGLLVGAIGGAFAVLFLFLWSMVLRGPSPLASSPFTAMLPLRYLATVFLCGFGGYIGERRSKPVVPGPVTEVTEQEALYRAGSELYNQARTRTGEEAEALYQAACEKYSAALAIKPNDPKVMNDWGAALLEQAHGKTPEEGKALHAQAEEKFLAAEELQPGIASYNLACIHGVRGEYEECQKHLEAARDHRTLPSSDHIEHDPDLASARRLDWFQRFMKSLGT